MKKTPFLAIILATFAIQGFFYDRVEAGTVFVHIPLPTDLFHFDTGNDGPVASSTAFMQANNVYHGRYIQITEQTISNIYRVYINACGDINAGGYMAIYNGSTITASTTNLFNLDFCTPAIDPFNTNYTDWPYFTFNGATIPNNGQMIWRLNDGADFLDRTSQSNFGVTLGTYGYLSGSFPTGNPFEANQNQSMAYLVMTDNQTPTNPPTPPVISESQYIKIIEPAPYGTTTASTSVFVSVNFSTPVTFDPRPETVRYYEIIDAVTGEVEYTYSETLPANTLENLFINDTLNLSAGSKTIRAYYKTTTNVPYSEIVESFFNVATNTYLMATGIDNPQSNPDDLTQIDCQIFDVGCQFQKALVFLFVPSQNVLDRFSNLWQSIRTKAPFGYVSAVLDQLTELDNSGTAAFDLGELPFMNTLFTPFKDAFAVIMWGIYAIYFYQHRLTKLDI